jgi:hypothetical protein
VEEQDDDDQQEGGRRRVEGRRGKDFIDDEVEKELDELEHLDRLLDVY